MKAKSIINKFAQIGLTFKQVTSSTFSRYELEFDGVNVQFEDRNNQVNFGDRRSNVPHISIKLPIEHKDRHEGPRNRTCETITKALEITLFKEIELSVKEGRLFVGRAYEDGVTWWIELQSPKGQKVWDIRGGKDTPITMEHKLALEMASSLLMGEPNEGILTDYLKDLNLLSQD